ncbi:rhodanese-like domain-containing protein [Robbsia andropogonis]|uniref:rhodanese-like domain-containing protein n=1 Tax=Robbsia andropogonis TaxID=28092 RepID=UPI00209EC12A|nr:rhodanese-like domain-containing protein [Robbsia andropogonis]MCP1120439.1 rhodanese-like domain-containing protein [Robbsia andropogonis]MCP1130310.1 rhodanese-like domain-containing protein [Robbsia andropogonis]
MTASSSSPAAPASASSPQADTAAAILARGTNRGKEAGLSYAGALTPDEAFGLLQLTPEALLVDVRTLAELTWVGQPDIPRDQYAHIEWNRWPGGARNDAFIEMLRGACGALGADRPVLMLCRSAVRSKAAGQLAAAHGFSHVFDVLEGFEGDKDTAGHRKSVGGWCWRGLPWRGA